MRLPKDPRDRKAAVIAACITFGAACVVLVLLFVLYVGSDRSALAEASMPELQDDEEIFLDPDYMVIDDRGDEDMPDIDEAAPQPEGVPDPAEAEQPVSVVQPQKPVEKPTGNKAETVSTTKQSDVKSTTPQPTDQDKKRIESMKNGKFTDNNGSATGKNSSNSGSGGDGVSAQGNVNGRTMEGFDPKKVKLQGTVKVTVNIKVDEEGKVKSATIRSGGNSEQQKACIEMAYSSRWTAVSGAPLASGTITFTLIPN